MMQVAIESPGGDRTKIHRQTKERQQHIGRQTARLTLQRCDLHLRQHRISAVQRVKLIRDDQLDLTVPRGGIELRRTLRRGTEFGPPMHHRHARDVLQGQRPVHRRIAAAGDHHALAAHVLAAADVVLHRA